MKRVLQYQSCNRIFQGIAVCALIASATGIVSESIQTTDPRQVVKALEADKQIRERLFDGLRITYEMTLQTSGAPPKPLLSGKFCQLDTQVWRCDVLRPEGLAEVMVRDDDFVFEAVDEMKGAGFRFGVLGYNAMARRNVINAMHFRNDLLAGATSLLKEDLLAFFQSPGLAIESISAGSPLPTGERTEIIRWKAVPDQLKFLHECHGLVEWIPEKGHLVSRFEWRSGSSGGSGNAAPASQASEVEWEMREGRFLPVKSIVREGKAVYVATITDVGKAPGDRKFYTAEAIGLKTPTNPANRRVLWIVSGSLLILLGIWFLKSRNG